MGNIGVTFYKIVLLILGERHGYLFCSVILTMLLKKLVCPFHYAASNFLVFDFVIEMHKLIAIYYHLVVFLLFCVRKYWKASRKFSQYVLWLVGCGRIMHTGKTSSYIVDSFWVLWNWWCYFRLEAVAMSFVQTFDFCCLWLTRTIWSWLRNELVWKIERLRTVFYLHRKKLI